MMRLSCTDIDRTFADRSRGSLLASLHAGSSTRRPLHQSQTPVSPSLAKAARADPALVNFAISMRAGTVDRQTESVTPALDAAKPSPSPAVPQHLYDSNSETGQRTTKQLYFAHNSEAGHFARCKERSPDRNRALSRGWPSMLYTVTTPYSHTLFKHNYVRIPGFLGTNPYAKKTPPL